MSVTVYVPLDAAALSVGAEAVATVLQHELVVRGIEARVVRNGCRGMLWLEPLVEVETPQGRIGYGPVGAADVPGLLDAGMLEGGRSPAAPGPDRGSALDGLPAAADLRPRRRHRARCRWPTTRRMAASPACAGRWRWGRPPSSRRW